MTINQQHLALLEDRGLNTELLAKLGVRSSRKLGDDTIAIPYYRGDNIVGTKYRTVGETKSFTQDRGSEQIFYNWNCLSDETLAKLPLIITEGEVDCWSALQSGFDRTVSVPCGAPSTQVGERSAMKYAFLETMPAIPDDLPVILATDNDEPGAALRADLALRLGRKRCKWVRYPRGCKDLNDALRIYGERGVVAAINTAQWIVGNVYKMADIPSAPEAEPYDSGFPGLKDHYRLRLGDFCVVTGIPSMGKTAWVDDIVCRMALRHKWPVCIASFEQSSTDLRRMMRSWYCGCREIDIDDESRDKADQWINEMFSFIVPDDESIPSLPWVMERMAAAALRFNSRLFVIDPWNELEHDRPDGMSLTEYIGASIRELKAFARKYETHVIVVSHPMKMRREDGKYPIPTLYDISDSAHWANKADIGVVVHRKEDHTIIRIAKSRYHQQIGTPGDVQVKYIWQRATYELADAPDDGTFRGREGER